MQAVILAGGLGTRLSEETVSKPKPMVEIGGMPILWHIMKIYSSHGIDDFIICAGYKSYLIKEFFANLRLHESSIRIDLGSSKIEFLDHLNEKWKVTILDTGDNTQTAGRLLKAAPFIEEETFCLTYGDGLSDIDIKSEIEFHKNHRGLVTIAGVSAPARFGALTVDGIKVTEFSEKTETRKQTINGGFFVIDKAALSYIENANSMWEGDPLRNIAQDGLAFVWEHNGYWQPMDTLREKNELESVWLAGKAPWKSW